ncbi:endonuclease/exonuclease/phosphatase family protein [Micromonosporaceae bacterium Da 78-11]
MKIISWALVLPGLLWTVVRLGGWERSGLVQLMAFTPYVAAWALLPAVLALATRHWWAGGTGVVVAVALAICVLPRTVPAHGPSSGVPLQVMTANMLFGRADPAAVVELVRLHDVAVLAVQEFSPTARTALAATGLGTLLPYSSLADEWGASGSAIYSRFPVTAAGARRNGGGFLQAYATIQPPGAGPLLVESAHPLAPSALSTLPGWRADLAAEPRPDPAGPPRILLGDFNATLDHAPLRELISAGYRDAADATGQGFVATWGPYDGDKIPPVTIDHVLVDERVGVREVLVRPLLGSDHRAVLAALRVPANPVGAPGGGA